MSTPPSPQPDPALSLFDRVKAGALAVAHKVESLLGLTPALEAKVDAELHAVDADVVLVESVAETFHDGIVAVEKALEGAPPKS